MPASEHLSHEASAPTNGQSGMHDLFALTDEQILEIEPEAQDVEISSAPPTTSARAAAPVAPASLRAGSSANAQEERSPHEAGAAQSQPSDKPVPAQPSTEHDVAPPAWLAAQMKDPWSGEEARELWNGVQQARQEAAAYRAAFATPEDARALKELYPGGVNEARAAADRARLLDQIDQAYFGTAGKPAEQISAARAQLAAMMLREDPAAFREMVFAGLRVLEEAGTSTAQKSVAQTFRPEGVSSSDVRASTGGKTLAPEGVSYSNIDTASAAKAQQATPLLGSASANEAQFAAYAAFEKSANEDLERRVGGVIERTLEQALPAASRADNGTLKGRLSGAIRHDVETALKGDRQLGEQIAQILSARRFDSDTRNQVVRLIDERARQLVPVAAKRVLNDWTQTTLSAHRGNATRADAASSRREVTPASLPASSSARSGRDRNQDPNRSAARSDARRVDYRKLSDEQILDL